MAKCPNCGVENPENSRFCIGCGNAITVSEESSGLKCSGCGAEVPPESKFCVGCGTANTCPRRDSQANMHLLRSGKRARKKILHRLRKRFTGIIESGNRDSDPKE